MVNALLSLPSIIKNELEENKMDEIILQNKNGQIVVSSRDVTEKFGKNHKDVLESIRNLTAENSAVKNMFILTTYKNTRGREYEEYLMNRDGFSLLAMGFTGKKALEWKLKYIKAFNQMEETLKSSDLISEEEKLKLKLFSKDPMEVAVAHNKLVEFATAPFVKQIEEDRPYTEFAKHVTESSDSIDVGDFAKVVKKENIQLGRNRLFQWFREKGYLMANNSPYQRYVECGYFNVTEVTKNTAYGINVYTKTLVTGKGQVYFVEKLRKEFGIAA